MPFINVYVRRKIAIEGRLNPSQQEMFKIGTVALAALKDRVQKALTPNYTPTKKLSKRWMFHKLRVRGLYGGNPKSGKRDLTYTGSMLRNLQVRKVSETQAWARNTTVLDRQKAVNNERIESWAAFGQKEVELVKRAARQIFPQIQGRLITAITGRSPRNPRGRVTY